MINFFAKLCCSFRKENENKQKKDVAEQIYNKIINSRDKNKNQQELKEIGKYLIEFEDIKKKYRNNIQFLNNEQACGRLEIMDFFSKIDLEELSEKEELQKFTINKAITQNIFLHNQYNFNGDNQGINSCGPSALAMIYQCLRYGNEFNIQLTLNNGYIEHKKNNIKNDLLPIEGLQHEHLDIDNGLENSYVVGYPEIIKYEEALNNLSNKIDVNNKIGALFLKNTKYSGIIIEKIENRVYVTITDSHGDYNGNAFAYTFNNIKNAACFLGVISPYRDTGLGVDSYQNEHANMFQLHLVQLKK